MLEITGSLFRKREEPETPAPGIILSVGVVFYANWLLYRAV